MKDTISTLAKNKSAGAQGAGPAAATLCLSAFAIFTIFLFLPQAALSLPKDGAWPPAGSTISQPNRATLYINQSTHSPSSTGRATASVPRKGPYSSRVKLHLAQRVIGLTFHIYTASYPPSGQVWSSPPTGSS